MLWHILTGEYPPQLGGVSDYTFLVAKALAAVSDEVQVWAPAWEGQVPSAPAVTVHRLPDHFGSRSFRQLDTVLSKQRRPFRLLVQYVPHMYGWKAMNLPFCLWLSSQRYARPWVMFHEVAYPVRWGQPFKHNLLGAVHYLMARMVAKSAERIFVSNPHWSQILAGIVTPAPTVEWLPVPSTMPTTVCDKEATRIRATLATESSLIIGHFGTYSEFIRKVLLSVLPELLREDERRVALLMGRGSEAFAGHLVQVSNVAAHRVRATGGLPPDAVIAHLQASDILLQPYPDGVCSRRTSLMAGLALGLPIATTYGRLTEAIWVKESLVEGVPIDDPGALVKAATRLLADPEARRQLGIRAAQGYRRFFSIERTVEKLLGKTGQTERNFLLASGRSGREHRQ